MTGEERSADDEDEGSKERGAQVGFRVWLIAPAARTAHEAHRRLIARNCFELRLELTLQTHATTSRYELALRTRVSGRHARNLTF